MTLYQILCISFKITKAFLPYETRMTGRRLIYNFQVQYKLITKINKSINASSYKYVKRKRKQCPRKLARIIKTQYDYHTNVQI